jgi:uncharacterized membrane protein
MIASPHKIFIVSMLLITVIAIALRWYHIDQRSLWHDELVTANNSNGTLQEALDKTRSTSSAPALHPIILQIVERFSDSPLAVRLPSLLAGVLAVLVLVVATRRSVSMRGAVYAGLIIALSSSQIHYSQEVREYSLSVLAAALMLLVYMEYTRNKSREWPLLVLCTLLLVVPFVQYGLVLFGVSIVGAMLVVRYAQGANLRRMVIEGGAAGLSIGAGGLGSLLLTLRHQMYLFGMQVDRGFYYNPEKHHNFLIFLANKTLALFSFVYLGPLLLGLIIPALIIYGWDAFKSRTWDPIIIVTLMSLVVAIFMAMLHLYPYGGMRQCIYLAPVLVLVAASALDHFGELFSTSHKNVVLVAIVVAILLAAKMDILDSRTNPYSVKEDIKPVLTELTRSIHPDDQVYLYYSAKPAFEFYKFRSGRLIYGRSHHADLGDYVTEIQESVDRETGRLWLVFTHVMNNEDSVILQGLDQDWDIKQVVDAKGSALYLARRKVGAAM